MPYVIKQANMYILHTDKDERLGSFYLIHGKAHLREEFEKAIEQAFELKPK